jgi:DNA-binding GntR family transcriptional regulator
MADPEEQDQDPIPARGYERSRDVVARRLEKRIRGQEWRYHAPLPSEPALSEWYGVSRTTIRAAAAMLEEKGMLERRHGKGTFVVWEGARR